MSSAVKIIAGFIALIFSGIMFLHGTTAGADKAWFSYAFGVFLVFASAASLFRGRVSQFCGSVVGLSIFIAALFYMGDVLLSEPDISSNCVRKPNVDAATLFLLVFGLPGIIYAVRAKFGFGKISSQPDIQSDDPPSSHL